MLREEDASDLDLVDECFAPEDTRKAARLRPFQPGDMVVHADDVEALGFVVTADKLGRTLVVWSVEPALIARRVADNKRELRDDIDRQIINDLLLVKETK